MGKYAVPATTLEARETLAALQTDLTEIQAQLNARKVDVEGLDRFSLEYREYRAWQAAAVHALTRKQGELRRLKILVRDASSSRPGVPSGPVGLLGELRGMCGRWIRDYGIRLSAEDQALLDAARAACDRAVEEAPLVEGNTDA